MSSTPQKSSRETFNSLVQDPEWYDGYKGMFLAFKEGGVYGTGQNEIDAQQAATEKLQRLADGIEEEIPSGFTEPDFVVQVTGEARKAAMEEDCRHTCVPEN